MVLNGACIPNVGIIHYTFQGVGLPQPLSSLRSFYVSLILNIFTHNYLLIVFLGT